MVDLAIFTKTNIFLYATFKFYIIGLWLNNEKDIMLDEPFKKLKFLVDMSAKGGLKNPCPLRKCKLLPGMFWNARICKEQTEFVFLQNHSNHAFLASKTYFLFIKKKKFTCPVRLKGGGAKCGHVCFGM